MGAINKPLVISSSSVLDKYLEKLNHYKFQDVTMLYKYEDNKPFFTIMLLDNPLCFPDAIASLAKHINDFHEVNKADSFLDLMPWDFDEYRDAVLGNQELKTTLIKGIIGQGSSSTAFLTNKNEVIKLSAEPLYPLPGKLIKGVDLPILGTYLMPKGKHKGAIYGVKEPLIENSFLRPISSFEYGRIRSDFFKKIKLADRRYDFTDDFSLNPLFAIQIGFLRDKPYILDHQVIKNRPLYEHY
jgi:hypothetical protein